jgi:hypothetical protein
MPAKENSEGGAANNGGRAQNQQNAAANGGAAGADDSMDTNLYSRQIYALGESAMAHLRKASVLVSGIGSVGLEIAKNLILGLLSPNF